MSGHWDREPNASLTPKQVVQVAHGHLIYGVGIATLTSLFATNQGRVSEAITVIRWAAENHMDIYREKFAKHKENGNAQQDTSPGTPDGGGSAQPKIR